jgi:guanylate kinase
MIKPAGPLLVITGPSAVGKTTVINALCESHPDFVRVLTSTTRPKRKTEKQGVHYHFLTAAAFLKLIKARRFAEWKKFNGTYYGTEAGILEAIWAKGLLPILSTEIKGAREWHRRGAAVVFLSPVSLKVLIELLKARDGESADTDRRIRDAVKGMQLADSFDYKIVNRIGKLDKTVAKVAKVAAKLLDRQRRSRK